MSNHIRALREAKGLTLEQLASAVGTSNQQISNLELGKRQLTVSWLTRLAAHLECHPWAIVADVDALDDGALVQHLHRLPPVRRARVLAAVAKLEQVDPATSLKKVR